MSDAATALVRDRCRGALIGLATGDALGTTLEFAPPGSFAPLEDLCGGGPFHLRPGQWTDDTSMALCLAESLIECRGYDARDQISRYLRWRLEGHLSSTGRCFDIGNTVATALRRFQADGEAYSGDTHPHSAGNGSLMRLAPVPMAWQQRPDQAIALAGDSSRTTHGAVEAVDACRYFAGLLVGAIGGETKRVLLAPNYSPVPGLWQQAPLAPKIAAVAAGSYWHKAPPEIRGTGYVVQSLEAALWAFARSDNFRAGALLAANLGEDADTTAAIYGQLAGAYYGESAIPDAWRGRLARWDDLDRLAEGLWRLGQSPTPR